MPSLTRGVYLAFASLAAALGPTATEALDPAPLAPAETDPTSAVLAPLVVAGIAGLRWEDVSPERTPTLWRLLDEGASAGAVTVFTSGRPSCADGGWLSLSAGRAVAASSFGAWCPPLPEVSQVGSGAVVRGWTGIAQERADTLYHPRIGTLGRALDEAGACATAVGPGAAIALADAVGRVEPYFTAVTSRVFECPLTMIDLGSTTVFETGDEQRMAVDIALGALVDLVPPDTDLMITSVSPPIAAPLGLGVVVVATERSFDRAGHGRLLTSPSTRWDGVVRLLDLPSTMTAALGVPEPAQFNGAPITVGAERPETARLVQDLVELTSNDRALRRVSASFTPIVSVLELLLLGGAALWLRRRRMDSMASAPSGWRSSGSLQTALLVVAAAPVAAYVVALVPWWRSGSPVRVIWFSIGAIALAVALVVRFLSRRSSAIWWPAVAVSGLTVAVLLADTLVGTPLQRLSPLGPSAVTGGRYYGIGNTSFAVLGALAVILCGGLAAWAIARRARIAAVLMVAVVGAFTLLVDVAPMWGADLGGGPALIPAFVVLAVLVSGAEMTWRRAGTIGATALGVIAVIALLDWLRPATQRSHAGRFVQSLLDGDAWETINRKGTYAIATITNGPMALVTIAIFVWLVLWVRRPERYAPREVRTTFVAWPTLHPTCVALLLVLGLGALANDYGVRVITTGLLATLPLLAAATLAAVDDGSGSVADPQAGGKLPARGSIAGTA